jgi:hypothetical protein
VANSYIAADLDHSIDAAAYRALEGLLRLLPRQVKRDDPAVSNAAVIAGSLVLLQALRVKSVEDPVAAASFKHLGRGVISNLKGRFSKSGQETYQMLNLVKRLNKVALISEVEYWMIPYLLEDCGLKQSRAEDLQPEVIRMLRGQVGQVDVLPYLKDAGQKKPRTRKGNDTQEVLGF